MKKGFTLVELSIVLVIIGLLIGGILAAQSMIGTAKIQALVRQVGQFDAAVENFQTKYQQLPGDTNLMGTSLGNNDGAIRQPAFPYDGWAAEPAKFWADLSKSGLTNPTGTAYTDNSDGTSDVSVNTDAKVPQSAAGNKAYFFAFGGATNSINYYVIGQPFGRAGAGSEVGFTMAFKPAETLAVDQKMDDGIANSGNIFGDDELNAGYAVAAPNNYLNRVTNFCTNAPASGPGPGPSYLIADQANRCNLIIRIGATTGNLK